MHTMFTLMVWFSHVCHACTDSVGLTHVPCMHWRCGSHMHTMHALKVWVSHGHHACTGGVGLTCVSCMH
jgi:hypothetical protein